MNYYTWDEIQHILQLNMIMWRGLIKETINPQLKAKYTSRLVEAEEIFNNNVKDIIRGNKCFYIKVD